MPWTDRKTNNSLGETLQRIQVLSARETNSIGRLYGEELEHVQ